MKNFPVEQDGKTFWVSRSMAVVCYCYADINGTPCVLVNKRGAGLPNNVGKWNCPSGFLDYDETLEEAACREVWEETGVKLDKSRLQFWQIDSHPERDAAQNVVVRYFYKFTPEDKPEDIKLTAENSEPNEVAEIMWLPIYNIPDIEWVSDRHMRHAIYCSLR